MAAWYDRPSTCYHRDHPVAKDISRQEKGALGEKAEQMQKPGKDPTRFCNTVIRYTVCTKFYFECFPVIHGRLPLDMCDHLQGGFRKNVKNEQISPNRALQVSSEINDGIAE